MLIGMVGFIGSGKGTVGDFLQNRCGYHQDSFARPLKDAVAAIFGWDRQLLEGNTPEGRAWREQPDSFWSEKFGYTFTPRLALQLMGTEAGRDVFHKDLWVISLLHRNQNKNTVITDVRFKNEIDLIRKNRGIVVRVQRGENPCWYSIASAANAGDLDAVAHMKELGIHQSEWDWIGAEMDYTIMNNRSLEALHQETFLLACLLDPKLTP